MDAVYYNPSNPASYGGVQRLKQKVKLGNAKNWLSYQDAYTLHKPVRRKFARRKILVGGIDRQWQIDLVDLTPLSKMNDNNKFLLTCIDVLSKYAWVIPIRNKSGIVVTDGMRNIFRQTDRRPYCIQADKGKEFYNKHFLQLLRDNNILIFSTENDDIKAAIVERFHRSLKERMWRMFTHTRKKRYVEKLQDLVSAYNHAKHRTIGMAPADATLKVETQLLDRMYDYFPKAHSTQLYKGDKVRISTSRMAFKKGYVGQWSEEIFQVISKKITRPVTYTIADLQDEVIHGTFYTEELQKIRVKADRSYTIESVLKKRTLGKNLQYFVKFKGYPSKFNQWITKDDVE